MPNSDCNDEASSVCSGSALLSEQWLRECHRSGHLEKRGHGRHTFRNWRRRFFTLRGVELLYFDVGGGAAVGDRRPRLRGRLNVRASH